MVPAGERLHAQRATRVQADLGLVVEDQLGLVHRAPQLADQRKAAGVVAVLVPARVVELVTRAVLLGHVHRHVGGPHHGLDGRAVVGEERDADRALALQCQAADHHRLLEHLEHAADDRDHRLPIGYLGQQDRELVATEARDALRVTEDALQPRPDPLKQEVAVVVAERVVDVLEAVEVHEHDHAHLVPAPDPGHRALEDVLEHGPVWQAGEPVGQRLLLLLRRLAAKALRRAGHDPDERAPEQEQPEPEHHVHRVRIALDLRGDPAVGHRQLERADDRRARAAEPHRDEHVEDTTERRVLRRCIPAQVADLGDRPTVQRGLRLGRSTAPGADQLVVVGVDDGAGPVAKDRAREVGALPRACERPVERSLLIRSDPPREIAPRVEHPAEGEVAHELRLVARGRDHAPARVRADRLAEEEPEDDDRDQADQPELDQPAALLLDARFHRAPPPNCHGRSEARSERGRSARPGSGSAAGGR